jgi:hypothetical protein
MNKADVLSVARQQLFAGNDLSHQKDIGLETRQATFVEAPQHGILEVGGLVFDRDMLVAKLA